MTMYGRSSSVMPVSMMDTMCGWLESATVVARSRAALTGTDPVSTVITLIATGRLSVVWMARKTSAVVPCAISSGLSYPGSAGNSGAFISSVPPRGVSLMDARPRSYGSWNAESMHMSGVLIMGFRRMVAGCEGLRGCSRVSATVAPSDLARAGRGARGAGGGGRPRQLPGDPADAGRPWNGHRERPDRIDRADRRTGTDHTQDDRYDVDAEGEQQPDVHPGRHALSGPHRGGGTGQGPRRRSPVAAVRQFQGHRHARRCRGVGLPEPRRSVDLSGSRPQRPVHRRLLHEHASDRQRR